MLHFYKYSLIVTRFARGVVCYHTCCKIQSFVQSTCVSQNKNLIFVTLYDNTNITSACSQYEYGLLWATFEREKSK